MKALPALTFVLALLAGIAHADIYSCKLPNGRTVLQSSPCSAPASGNNRTPGQNRQPSPATKIDHSIVGTVTRTCMEEGYDPRVDKASFKQCMRVGLLTFAESICGEILGIDENKRCMKRLFKTDAQYGKTHDLNYECIGRGLEFGTAEYETCSRR